MVRGPLDGPPGVDGPPAGGRAGFTMVEVIVAMIVLAFGLLGMAGTTALVVRQVSLADVTTERSVALQTTLERLQALPFDSVANGSDSIGLFGVQWSVTTPSNQWKLVEVITDGPGMSQVGGGMPMLTQNVADTFKFRIIRP